MITYAVGDIHGRLDLLTKAIIWIGKHSKDQEHRIVFLGDYVDRGPQSKEVMQLLMAGPDNWICLKGNHEQMAYVASKDRDYLNLWLMNGGIATRKSFGQDYLPKDHLDWIESLPLYFEDENNFYVHAGVEPESSLEKMKRWHTIDQEGTFLWIRESFLISHYDWGKLIIHGHTPQESGAPTIKPNRINLDTGAFFTGILTIGVFGDDPADIGIKQVREDDGHP